MVLPPNTLNSFAVLAVEHSGAFQHVVVKLTLDVLPVGEHQNPTPLFKVLHEIACVSLRLPS